METLKSSKKTCLITKPIPKEQRPIGKRTVFFNKCFYSFIPSIAVTIFLSEFMKEALKIPQFIIFLFGMFIFTRCFSFLFKRMKIIRLDPTMDQNDSLDYVGNFNHPQNPFSTTTPSSARYVDTQSQNAHFQQDSQRSNHYYNHYHNR